MCIQFEICKENLCLKIKCNVEYFKSRVKFRNTTQTLNSFYFSLCRLKEIKKKVP